MICLERILAEGITASIRETTPHTRHVRPRYSVAGTVGWCAVAVAALSALILAR
jgi:hypothetical protein